MSKFSFILPSTRRFDFLLDIIEKYYCLSQNYGTQTSRDVVILVKRKLYPVSMNMLQGIHHIFRLHVSCLDFGVLTSNVQIIIKPICRVTLVSAGLTKSYRVYFLLSRIFIFGRLLVSSKR